MFRLHHLFRFQYALAAGCLLVTLLFLVVYRPLARKASSLDQKLKQTWQQLVDINLKNKLRLGMDFESVNGNLLVAEKSIRSLKQACQQVRNQLEFDAATQERLHQPFQLLDYDQKRFQVIDRLTRQAVSNRVSLEPVAVAGLPQYQAGQPRAELLWAQLSLADRILTIAVTNRTGTVRSLALLPSRLHHAPNATNVLFEEFPIQVSLTGSMESVLQFLSALPSRKPTSEGVGAAVPVAPALFLDRMILKSSPGGPNEVSLEAVICGFLNRSEIP